MSARPIPGIPFPGEEAQDARWQALSRTERRAYGVLVTRRRYQQAAEFLNTGRLAAKCASRPNPQQSAQGRQTRLGSLIETVANTAIGFGIAMLTNHIVMPAFGHALSVRDNFWITCVFTVVSLVRGYMIRRIFTRIKSLHK